MIFSLLLLACHTTPEPTAPPRDLSDRVTWAGTAPVDELAIATLPAEVVAAPDGAQHLGPGVAARLVSWRVRAGDVVQAGSPLAELRSEDLSGSAGVLASLQAELAEAEAVAALRAQAVDRGVLPSGARAEADAIVERLRAQVNGARTALGAHAELRSLSDGRWLWTATASGTVDALTCTPGPITADEACLQLVSADAPVLEVHVPERLVGRLQGPVRAHFVSASGTTFRGVEQHRAPRLDPDSRTLALRFAPIDSAPLLGSSGRAQLLVTVDDDSLREVPVSAVTRSDGRDLVFVEGDGGARSVEVERVGRVGDRLAVRGLPSDARVATSGVFLLKSLALLEEAP